MVDLPFTFNWLNVEDVTKVTVIKDGYITIRTNAAIEILSADLNPGNSPGGGIYNKTNADGSFTISWEKVGFFDGFGNPGPSGELNAQATLYADGRVNLCYDGTGSIPAGIRPFSRLTVDGPSDQFYLNPLEDAAGDPYFDATSIPEPGAWIGEDGTHPDGCACFYLGTPAP